jgi:hypothetical protein
LLCAGYSVASQISFSLMNFPPLRRFDFNAAGLHLSSIEKINRGFKEFGKDNEIINIPFVLLPESTVKYIVSCLPLPLPHYSLLHLHLLH